MGVVSTAVLLVVGLWGHNPDTVHADSVIVVNSTADDSSNDGECTLREAINAANDDLASGGAAGECIAGSGTDTITFGLTGGGDYTLGASSGYTIAITSLLPAITEPVTINGYSQPGSIVNTAVSPAPLNGKILVEVDGLTLSTGNPCFIIDGVDGAVIKGLLINSCGSDGVRLINDTTNTAIQGNFIGVGYDDSTDIGTISKPNGQDEVGVASGSGIFIEAATYTTIGGTNPEDRNVISGNQFSEIFIESFYSGSDPDEPTEAHHTTIQGNYFGLGADGLTAMPCGYGFGHGNSILVTHSSNDQIGGTSVGAKNVIAASKEYGVSFRNGSNNSVVEGNYIGTDYTGNSAVTHSLGTGHAEAGVSVATVSGGGYTLGSHDIRIGGPTVASQNIVSGNTYNAGSSRGIFLHDTVDDIEVQNNLIGVGADGTPLANDGAGIEIDESEAVIVQDNHAKNNGKGINITGSDDVTIVGNIIQDNTTGITLFNTSNSSVGGTTTNLRNLVSGNGGSGNIEILGVAGSSSGNSVKGNYIGTKADGTVDTNIVQNAGVAISGAAIDTIIGGDEAGAGNIIAGNTSGGVIVNRLSITGLGSVTPTDIAVVGNSIFESSTGNFYGTTVPGIGIDLLTTNLNGSFIPEGVEDAGPTLNDALDVDDGPNSYLNFPILNSAKQSGTSLELNFDLDVADSPSDEYRVEFFANDAADSTGYGEGQSYIGAVTVSNADDNTITLSLPSGMDLTDKMISATTTSVDSSTNSGYGSTSEFSAVLAAEVISSQATSGGSQPSSNTSTGNLGKTGQNSLKTILIAAVLVVSTSAAAVIAKRKNTFKLS